MKFKKKATAFRERNERKYYQTTKIHLKFVNPNGLKKELKFYQINLSGYLLLKKEPRKNLEKD
ncbi:hypothetical protein BpHYR1_014086 [Brachionus plicatilis]|uniref:Uncharacterized protein n=1 Tax=Brachionus plicatilis TaxID=10195 RepID=A0A3M7SFW0_BRAPC|nr:hypothetical protein BpHYR1_014086 [Brachionus plicatilis]